MDQHSPRWETPRSSMIENRHELQRRMIAGPARRLSRMTSRRLKRARERQTHACDAVAPAAIW
eukprot:6208326-Pleurochrysis_carterae.AAC.2